MNREFWLDRWASGQIGFHEGAVNRHLQQHWPDRPGTVLVPLCGKTHDLHALVARGHTVTGVELSAAACDAVFAEHGLTPTLDTWGPYVRRRHGALTVLEGDFFALTGQWDAVWDRAALIALPPDMRPRYVAHLRTLLGPGAHVLLVTLDYPQAERAGPPFSVPADEVRSLWPEARLLHSEPLTGDRVGNVSRLRDEVWSIDLPG